MEQPTQEEINRVLDWCMDASNSGETAYFGMTYEDGVRDGINWMEGNSESAPDE